MNEFAIILMKKDKENVIIEEVATLDIGVLAEYINSIFIKDNNGEEYLSVQLSTKAGVEDWEYTAIYDYYEDVKVLEFLKSKGKEDALVSACEEEFNPTWEFTFKLTEDIEELEALLKEIIQVHQAELQDVFLEIKDKEEEYL
ncbi:MAG: DUF6762 family protein [Proteocatella sp.]